MVWPRSFHQDFCGFLFQSTGCPPSTASHHTSHQLHGRSAVLAFHSCFAAYILEVRTVGRGVGDDCLRNGRREPYLQLQRNHRTTFIDICGHTALFLPRLRTVVAGTRCGLRHATKLNHQTAENAFDFFTPPSLLGSCRCRRLLDTRPEACPRLESTSGGMAPKLQQSHPRLTLRAAQGDAPSCPLALYKDAPSIFGSYG